MSHFSVLVIGEDLHKQLAPYHEFECTGDDNEYVQDIDRTEAALAKFAEATETRLRAPDGTLHSYFDEKGEWKPEFSQPDTKTFLPGRRTYFVPPGYEEIEVPAKGLITAAQWISDYYGWPIAGKDDGEKLKYGYIEVDAEGNVVRCIDRTNPSSKWDWYTVGGRWSGMLILKPGAKGEKGEPGVMGSKHSNDGVDCALKGDVDFDGMRDKVGARAALEYDEIAPLIAGRDWRTWEDIYNDISLGDIDARRDVYHAQAVIADFKTSQLTMKYWRGIDRFRCTREEYIARERDSAISTFVVVKDGKWYERGEMGWFGYASNEKDQDTWNREFASLIDGLPGDTKLTVVDCHI